MFKKLLKGVFSLKLKKLFGAGLGLLLCLTFTTGVYAENTNDVVIKDSFDVNIKGGSFELTTSPLQEFGEITIEIDDIKYSTSFERAFIVKDLRGLDDNWQLTVSSSTLRNKTRNLEFPNVLSISQLSKIERQGNTTFQALPEINHFTESILDDGDVLIANSKNGSGAGQFALTFPNEAIHITVTPEMKQGQYEFTLNWNLLSVPGN